MNNHTIEQYMFLVNGIKDYAIYMLDPSGNISTWNSGAKNIKGYAEAEVVGKNVRMFYRQEDIENHLPETELKIALEKGKYEGEGWRVKKDKTLFWANLIVTPTYNDQGKHIGFSKITRDLTEIRKMEKSALESKEKLELLIQGVESITDYGIFALDENGFITTWNKGAERIKGYTEEEIIGKHFSVFYPTDVVEAGYPDYELQKASSDGRFEDEGWRKRKDGSKFWANVIISTIYDDRKNVVGFTKVTRDLTERKLAEMSLKTTEDKHRLLIEQVEDYAIFLLDREGYVSSWNAGAEKIKGYTAQEIIGKHFSRFYPKKAIDDNFPAYELRQAIKNGKFEDQGWRVRKDGSIFWANVVITALKNERKEIVGFAKITRDLTEQKKTERILKESEERLRLLLESITDYGIFMLDPFGNISSWNLGAERIKGYRSEEVIGKHFSIFYDEESRRIGYPDDELKIAKEKGRFEGEGWRIRKDGSKFWANVILSPVRNFDNKLIGYSKITRDLTERKKQIEALERKNIELKHLNDDLDSFIYSASHDLKSPITNIEGLINALSKAIPTSVKNEKVGSIIGMMSKSVVRFKETVEDMTEVSKIQKSFEDKPEEIDLEKIVEDIKETLYPTFEDHEISLIINYDSNQKVKLIKSNVRTILYNLISNSIKFKSPERTVEIEIELKQLRDKILFEVKDNGLGIDLRHRESIFGMFKRYHTHVEGSGIGLYIVKRIVDNLRGKIEVESTIGEGSTFRVFLPTSN